MEQGPDVILLIRENYDSFSKSHRKLADFILENPSEVAFLSINELSQKISVSPATITRFARRLNFHGYPEFQRGLYEFQKRQAPFGQLKSLLRGETAAPDPNQDPLQWAIQNNIRLLEGLYTPQTQAAFQRAQELLRRARTIYIVGLRSSFAAAYYLFFMLHQMLGNVRLLDASPSELPTALIDVQAEDCLIVVSYARYTRASYDIVSHFHQKGCGIVALTDSLTSPIALKSTEVLIAANGENFSPVAAITLCNALITSLGRMDAQRTLERMEQQDKIALQHHVYL